MSSFEGRNHPPITYYSQCHTHFTSMSTEVTAILVQCVQGCHIRSSLHHLQPVIQLTTLCLNLYRMAKRHGSDQNAILQWNIGDPPSIGDPTFWYLGFFLPLGLAIYPVSNATASWPRITGDRQCDSLSGVPLGAPITLVCFAIPTRHGSYHCSGINLPPQVYGRLIIDLWIENKVNSPRSPTWRLSPSCT